MNDSIVIAENTTVPLTVAWIKDLAIRAAHNPTVIKWSEECSQSIDVLQCVFDRAYDAILYKPDPVTKQNLRTIENILREREGNCVTYCQLIGAMLINLNIPFRYKVISVLDTSDPNFQWHHIYTVTLSGVVLDPVLGHKQDGTDTRENRPKKGFFNKEGFYKSQNIYPMPRLEILQGYNTVYNPNAISFYSNRSKLSRYGLLNGRPNISPHLGCSCNDQLGKTIFGKILSSVTNTGKAIANLAVSPVEAITGTQIIGPNYGGNQFFEGLDKGISKGVAAIGNIASNAVTGGAIKFKDPYAVQAQKEAEAQAQQQAQQQAMLAQMQPQAQQSGIGMLPILLLGGGLAVAAFSGNDKKKKKKKGGRK